MWKWLNFFVCLVRGCNAPRATWIAWGPSGMGWRRKAYICEFCGAEWPVIQVRL
jgi:hypothetical protein